MTKDGKHKVITLKCPHFLVDEVSDALWDLKGVVGIEEAPSEAATHFEVSPDLEFLEFGSEAAERAESYLRTEAYRGKKDIFLRIFCEDHEALSSDFFVTQFCPRFKNASYVKSETLAPQDYLQTYKESVQGVSFGDGFWVGPPWATAPKNSDTYFIEPGLAFGTGEHPTTQMALRCIRQLAEQHKFESILDLGTGSGILGVALKRYYPKARLCLADLDPLCEAEVTKTFALNKLETKGLRLRFGEHGSARRLCQDKGHFDLVVSNIYAEVLAEICHDVAELLRVPSKGAPNAGPRFWLCTGIYEGKSAKIFKEAYSKQFQLIREYQESDNDGANWFLWLLSPNKINS